PTSRLAIGQRAAKAPGTGIALEPSCYLANGAMRLSDFRRMVALGLNLEETVMSTKEVADALVAMWKQGTFAESGEQYWARDVVSVEPGGPSGMDPVSRGIDAARGKGEWWANAH